MLPRQRAAREARALLDELVRRRVLVRRTIGAAAYYTLRTAPLAPALVHEAFSILWFCCMGTPARPLLEPTAPLLTLVDEGARALRVSTRAPQCAYLAPPRVALLHVTPRRPAGRPLDLQRALRALQVLVCARAFRPWLLLARADGVALTCLVPGEAEAAELDRWLARHPLIARTPDTVTAAHGLPHAVPIPATAVPLVELRGT